MATQYRQLVKRAIAAYFGGTEQTAAEGLGVYYQGGPLSSLGLVTALPWRAKGFPDQFYFATPGVSAGCVMTVQLLPSRLTRQALGGPVSGWRDYTHPMVCHLWQQSHYQHAEQAESQLDDLIEAFVELIWADRTLGTTDPVKYPNPPWPDSRLIVEAGEKPFGIKAVAGEPEFLDDSDPASALETHAMISFETTTYFQA